MLVCLKKAYALFMVGYGSAVAEQYCVLAYLNFSRTLVSRSPESHDYPPAPRGAYLVFLTVCPSDRW